MADRVKFVDAYVEVMDLPGTPVAWWKAMSVEEKRVFAGKVFDAGADTSPEGEAKFVAGLEQVCDHVVAGGGG